MQTTRHNRSSREEDLLLSFAETGASSGVGTTRIGRRQVEKKICSNSRCPFVTNTLTLLLTRHQDKENTPTKSLQWEIESPDAKVRTTFAPVDDAHGIPAMARTYDLAATEAAFIHLAGPFPDEVETPTGATAASPGSTGVCGGTRRS